MLDIEKAKLTQFGSVTINSDAQYRVTVAGFDGDGCSCRDLSALAMTWAIGELQRELLATLMQPGGGSCAID